MSRIGQGIKKSVLTANSVLYAVTASVPAALSMAASRILGRKSSGNIAAMTVAELLTLIGVEAGATADLDGDEIVILLEALAGAAQLSHTKISDVTSDQHHAQSHDLASHSTKAHSELSDAPEGAHHTKFTTTEHSAIGNGAPHHTKYTDSNARAAAVSNTAYAASWNGVTTIAPSKNAVYDKIETLGAGVTVVRKTADETVNNSITLQNDDHLLFAIGANEVWEITLYMRTISATTAPDIRYNWAVPSGAEYGFKDLITGLATADIIPSVFNVVVTYVSIAYVINGATPGNMQLQWAQRAAASEDTKVLTNSFLIAQQIL